MDGIVIGGTVVSRRWLLNAAVVSTASTFVATAAGALIYEVIGSGPGGTTTGTSDELRIGSANGPNGPRAKPAQLGYNITPDAGQDGGTFMYLDRMKGSGCNDAFWIRGDNQSGQVPVTAHGYPTGLGGASDIKTFVSLRRPHSGVIRHVLRTNAVGLNWQWALTNGITIVDSSNPQRVVFDVGPEANETRPNLQINGATVWPDYKPDNPIESRDGIAIYELEHEAAYLSGKLLHPRAVTTRSTDFAERFMDARHTNDTLAQTAADRTPVGSCSYLVKWGIPVEAMVAWCNELRANLWYCLPHRADESYMQAEFAYVRDHLDPALYFQLEYSNEVWNLQFGNQHGHAQAQGQALGGKDHNFGYGYLAAKMVRKAKEVFGTAAGRVLGMFPRQGANIYSFTDAALGVEALEGKKTCDYFIAASPAFYMDGGLQDLGAPHSSEQQVQMLMDEVALWEHTGIIRQPLIDQMRTGAAIPGWPSGSNLASLASGLDAVAAFCRAENIPHMVGYEGQNLHTSFFRLGDVQGRRANGFVLAIINDPRFSGTQPGSIMRDQYAMMAGKGMTDFQIFLDFGDPSQYGVWLSEDNLFSPPTPRGLFYDWWLQNAPDQVLFEINVTGGGPNMTVNQPTSRRISSFGGLMPASKPVLKSGELPPGMAFIDGRLSGTPNVAGSFTAVFAARDAGGREVAEVVTYTVAALAQYRFFRLTPYESLGADFSNGYIRVGTDDFWFMDGGTRLPTTGYTATTESQASNGPQNAIDANPDTFYCTDQGGAMNRGRIRADTGPGAGIKPTHVCIRTLGVVRQFSFDGVLVEASKDDANWITVADVPKVPNSEAAMNYVDGLSTIALNWPA